MANKTITQLAALTGADASIGDVLPIVDISDTSMSVSGTTKKITLEALAQFVGGGGASIGDLLNTARTINDPSYLVCDGSIYLKSQYPELASIIRLAPPNLQTEISPQPQISGPANPQGVDISSDGVYFAVASNTAPFLTIYKRTGETLVALPTPYVIPNAIARGCSFSPDGTYLAVKWTFNDIFSNAPSLVIYKRDGDVFTKLPDPVDVAIGLGISVKFSPDGLHLITSTSAGGAQAIIYQRTDDNFTKIIDPFTTQQSNTSGEYEYSKDGNFLSIGSTTPLIVFKRIGDSYNFVFSSSGLPRPASFGGQKFTNDGKFLVFGASASGNSGGHLQLIKIVGDTFTFLQNAIPVQNVGAVKSLCISNDSKFVFVNYNAQNTSVDPLPQNINHLYEIIGETLIRREFKQLTPLITSVNSSIFSPNDDVLALVQQVSSGSNPTFRVLKSSSYDQAVSFQVPLAAPVAGTITYIKAL
jgi:hypothetical protein